MCVSCCCVLVVLLFGAGNNSTVVFRSTEAMVYPFSLDWFSLDLRGLMDTMFMVFVTEKNWRESAFLDARRRYSLFRWNTLRVWRRMPARKGVWKYG